jgi:hypothetical protein
MESITVQLLLSKIWDKLPGCYVHKFTIKNSSNIHQVHYLRLFNNNFRIFGIDK